MLLYFSEDFSLSCTDYFFPIEISMATACPQFALVLWMGDPKPDCWQVIKTSQIQAKPEDILEGKSFDAIWKKDEETSVATVLKLGGMYYNCSYLISSVVHLYLVQLSRWMISLAFQFKFHEQYRLTKELFVKENKFVCFIFRQ